MARQVELIVETGAIVANANSFVNETAIINFAKARGVTLPSSTDEEMDAVAILGIQAMDYLAILPWKGEPVSPVQTTPWPRKNTGTSTPENIVPPQVREAQLQLSLMTHNGIELIPTYSGSGYLIEQRIGPIVERYSEKVGISSDGLPLFPGIMALLDPWLLGDLDGIVPVMIRSVGEKIRGR